MHKTNELILCIVLYHSFTVLFAYFLRTKKNLKSLLTDKLMKAFLVSIDIFKAYLP